MGRTINEQGGGRARARRHRKERWQALPRDVPGGDTYHVSGDCFTYAAEKTILSCLLLNLWFCLNLFYILVGKNGNKEGSGTPSGGKKSIEHSWLHIKGWTNGKTFAKHLTFKRHCLWPTGFQTLNGDWDSFISGRNEHKLISFYVTDVYFTGTEK